MYGAYDKIISVVIERSNYQCKWVGGKQPRGWFYSVTLYGCDLDIPVLMTCLGGDHRVVGKEKKEKENNCVWSDPAQLAGPIQVIVH